MRSAVVLVVAVLLASCGGSDDSLVDRNPGPAAQLAVEGVANAVLVCELGVIGGVVGPSAVSPLGAAEDYARKKGWLFTQVEETGSSGDRFLFVFLDADGAPAAEVAVGRSDAQPAADLVDDDEGWRVWGVQSCL